VGRTRYRSGQKTHPLQANFAFTFAWATSGANSSVTITTSAAEIAGSGNRGEIKRYKGTSNFSACSISFV
jgi:hypothetical protein